jgi:hypothetical protein
MKTYSKIAKYVTATLNSSDLLLGIKRTCLQSCETHPLICYSFFDPETERILSDHVKK